MVKKTTTETSTEIVTPSVTQSVEPFSPNQALQSLPPERDEFASSEYLDPNARLPRLQALRGISPETCGYFITNDQLAKSGWIDFDPIADKLINYNFESSGQVEQGLLIQSPRMLVVPRTPVLAFDRSATQSAEELVIVSTYRKEYKEDENIGNTQCFEVFLLDENNRPLHQVPFSYWAKGANQATFSLEWQKLVDEVTACHALANGVAARGKNNLFKSLCVFSFTTARELVGKKQRSFACRVIGHEVPNMQNWRSYFVGFDDGLKHQVWEGLQPTMPLMIPGASLETPALPGAIIEDE